eukprot:2004304-Amphidinium_carterae.1
MGTSLLTTMQFCLALDSHPLKALRLDNIASVQKYDCASKVDRSRKHRFCRQVHMEFDFRHQGNTGLVYKQFAAEKWEAHGRVAQSSESKTILPQRIKL